MINDNAMEKGDTMKILIASDAYKFQTSGVANVVITLVTELRRRGHRVKVLALSNNRESYRDGDDYYIRSLPAFVYPDLRLSLARHDVLLDELRAWRPDIIHVHTEGSALRMGLDIAARNHTPFVMTTHTDYAQYVFGRFYKTFPSRLLAREWGWTAYHKAAVIISPSEKALSFPQLSTMRNHAVVIPNGICMDRYRKPVTPEEKRELFRRVGFTDNGKTLVIVSRLSREKNIREILHFFPTLLKREPEAQLVIVGDGPDREVLEVLSRRLGIAGSVCFTGRVSPEKVYRFYNMGDLFVSASTFEVHSLTYLEAMTCGLPLVCRKDPCLKGVLKDGVNGYTYQTEKEFVSRVTQILNDRGLQQRMSRNALKRSEAFTDQRFVDRTVALYRKVLQAYGKKETPLRLPGESRTSGGRGV